MNKFVFPLEIFKIKAVEVPRSDNQWIDALADGFLASGSRMLVFALLSYVQVMIQSLKCVTKHQLRFLHQVTNGLTV